ncbi:hypothetical protein O181_026567 [Austropuccinia psidii MF-1]|uniref:Integrase catalytic domain-containing protein n=1 Tax=Austropuccinia psidii MF-1 TaxID=1389203 RepID=A0A9Q3H0W5_9BASI|nr:hypothetical protein [Austropuccinia psidii MF-1]
MRLCSRFLINTILHECHDSIYSEHLSEDRTLEKNEDLCMVAILEKKTIEYCHTCDRCQKANSSTGKKFGLMIHIQEPKSLWKVVHMDWVTALPPSGDRRYNSCLVIINRYSKTPIFLPCHKDDTAMDTAILLWSRVISHTGLFGTKLSFSTAYHPQTDVLAEIMIQTLEDMIRRFCAYGFEFKDSYGFTHDWCTLIPALELAYNTSVHSSTGQTPAMLQKGWNPRLPPDTLRKYLIDIHPTASSFKIMLDKVKYHAKKSPKKLENSYVGPFVIFSLHGTNAVQAELSGELENEHTTFPVSLIEPYQPADKELFPLRNPTPLAVPPVEQNEDKKINKFIKEGRLRGKIKQNIMSDMEIQYMKMNGWRNKKSLTDINSQEDLDMKEAHKPEYVYKCALCY